MGRDVSGVKYKFLLLASCNWNLADCASQESIYPEKKV